MATREAKRKRAVHASQRIDAAVASLARMLGLALPEPGPTAKDPELREIQQREWLADVLEQAVATLQAAEAAEPESAETDSAPSKKRKREQS